MRTSSLVILRSTGKAPHACKSKAIRGAHTGLGTMYVSRQQKAEKRGDEGCSTGHQFHRAASHWKIFWFVIHRQKRGSQKNAGIYGNPNSLTRQAAWHLRLSFNSFPLPPPCCLLGHVPCSAREIWVGSSPLLPPPFPSLWGLTHSIF